MNNKNCIFCKIIKGELPSYKIYEDDIVLAFLDIAPVNPGHTLVIPKEHFTNTLETPDNVLKHISITTKKIANAILKAVGTDACNITMNNGKTAGQVVFHTHWHIIPRLENDGHKLWSGREYEKGQAEETAKNIRSII